MTLPSAAYNWLHCISKCDASITAQGSRKLIVMVLASKAATRLCFFFHDRALLHTELGRLKGW